MNNTPRKSRRKTALSDEDIALFRQTAGAVNPLRPSGRAELARSRKKPPRQPHNDNGERAQHARDSFSDFESAETVAGDTLSYARPGVQRAQLRKMRSGDCAIHAELDLHGMTLPEARQALAQFLAESRRHGARYLRIIHGKGYHSRGQPPVLKNKLNHWLRQSDGVLAFCSAPPAGGGTGAVYVLIVTASERSQ